MDEIWANRLSAGTRTWAEVPESRKDAVMAVLEGRVEKGSMTAEQCREITGKGETE